MKLETKERNIEIYYKYKLMLQRKIKQYDALEVLSKEYKLGVESIKHIVSHLKGVF